MTICFYGDIFKAFSGKVTGGGELQIVSIARYLSLEQFKVVVIDFNSKEKDGIYDGIHFYFIKNCKSNFNTAFISLLYHIEADIYYGRIRTFYHIIPLIISRIKGAKFILGLAHDLDVSSFRKRWEYYYRDKPLTYFLTKGFMTEVFYFYVLKHADLVIAQHSDQLFSKVLNNAKKIQINNIFDQSILNDTQERVIEFDYIYIGALNIRKGLENLVKTVKSLPYKKFIIIGRPYGSKNNFRLYEELKKIKDLKLIMYANHNDIFEYIKKSKALISTSASEGFPNVFLEAWALGKPVVSLNTNPGKIFDKYNLGFYCNGNFNLFKEVLFKEDFCFNSKEISQYVLDYHDPKSNIIKLSEKLAEMIKI